MKGGLLLLVAASAALAGAPRSPRAGPAAAFDPGASNDTLLARALELAAALEYEPAAQATQVLLARETLTVEQRIAALRLRGSVLAIVSDPVDAEVPFRLLLRAQPDADLPPTTAPKILGVFRKVQAEEKAVARQLHDLQRQRTISELRLVSELPAAARGGRPLPLVVRLKDPAGAIEVVRLPYRREGLASFSTLALERSDDGAWRGSIPADFLADEAGFTLEYFLETADAEGPLLSVGSALSPRRLNVEAGALERPRPVSRRAFGVSAGVTGLTGLAAGGLGIAFNLAQAQYQLLGGQGAAADRLLAQAGLGEALGTAVTAALISFGVSLVVTLILAPLTEFGG